MAKSGIPVARIRSSLEQLRRWLPDVGTSLAQLCLLEESGRLLVRYDDARLAEPCGQLRFDFEIDGGADSIPWPDTESTEELFEMALELDDAGCLPEAEALYRRLTELDPNDPVFHFNLANIEYAQGKLKEAAADYLRTTQLDGEYVEAWSGLGCVLSELGPPKEAIVALRRAIDLVPNYGDAHFNLADVQVVVIIVAEGMPQLTSVEHGELVLRLQDATADTLVLAGQDLAVGAGHNERRPSTEYRHSG